MITKVTIFGERCTGTNYIEYLIKQNFNVDVVWDYGWKHFFGFNDLSNSDDTIFVCIVRNPHDWLNSLYSSPHHFCDEMLENKHSFLNSEVFSVDDIGYPRCDNVEILNDRNIYTNERYKNIFELRHVKLKYMIETLPSLVKNYVLVRYEDLLENFDETMNKFTIFNIERKNNGNFINEIEVDTKYGGKYEKRTYTTFTKDEIYNHENLNLTYEKMLNYV